MVSSVDAKDPEYLKILYEIRQSHETRIKYYEKLEETLGLPILCYFTSFRYPVAIDDNDVVMFEDILQKMDLTNGVALLINSPGGDGEAAERIVKICRSFSKTGEFKSIVLGKAKSAATLVCFGASEIFMSETSELGPIDPQVIVEDQRYSAYNLIKTFNNLFERAVTTKGNLEPFLQQLHRLDAYDIAEFESWMELSQDIAIKILKTGMMNHLSADKIKEKIDKFLIPEEKKTHSRPIYANECLDCDLNITIIDKLKEVECWGNAYKLYSRLHNLTNRLYMGKILENKHLSLSVSVDRKGDS